MSTSVVDSYLVRRTAMVLVQLVTITLSIFCAFWLALHPRIFALIGIVIFVWFIAAIVPATRPMGLFIPMLVCGPILLRHRRYRPRGRLESIQQLPESISEPVRSEHDRLRSELEREGFVSGGMFILSDMWFSKPGAPSDQMIVEGFTHRTRMHGAVIMTMVSNFPSFHPRPTLRFMERLSEGVTLTTTNSEFPPMYPILPTSRVLFLPDVLNASEIYALHQRALERLAPGHRFPGPAPEGWEAAMHEENRIAFEDWMSRGFMVQSSPDGEYRHHWYWHIRTTWNCTPPIMHFRRWLLRRRTKRFRRELGI